MYQKQEMATLPHTILLFQQDSTGRHHRKIQHPGRREY